MIRRIAAVFTLFMVVLVTLPAHAAPPAGALGGQATTHTDVLTYTASPTPGVTYTMYRAPGTCSASSVFTVIGSGITALTFTDATPLPGVQCYRVTANIVVNNVPRESAPSNDFSLTSLVVPQQPQPPTGLAGSAN